MEIRRKPDWLKIKLGGGENYPQTKKIVEQHHLHTICSSGKCPNIGECWSKGTATFMILGEICTRSCKFCATMTGKPLPADPNEPKRVAESVHLMKLKHCVITSVDRDDMPDKGAKHWADTITEIRNQNPNTIIEILVPDFDANKEWIDIVLESQPDVYGHNMETVERLSNQVRSRAKYAVSLDALKYAADKGFITKSGIMAGLGETKDEVIQVMKDLRAAGCRLFTIGQYLQPTPQNLDIVEYVTPEQFAEYKQIGNTVGIFHMEQQAFIHSETANG